VQLWLALPDADRQAAPAFEHHRELPVLAAGGMRVTVFAGSLADVTSPARTFSPVVGAEVSAARDTSGTLPLVASHEHVIFVADGQAAAAETPLVPGQLLYLAPGRGSVTVAAQAGTRLLLLGGEPLGEPLLMWWNFVARTPADITQAARAWADGQFGDVPGYRGVPMPAPPLDPARLRPAS